MRHIDISNYFKVVELKPMKKGQLNRMCKYFKNKKVYMSYEYNNSLCHHQYREYIGKYDRFEIIVDDWLHNGVCYTIKFYLKGKWVFEESFMDSAEFYGLGKIKECNSGSYCYFEISVIKPWYKRIFTI